MTWRLTERTEHMLVDRVVPLLLIVVLPLLAALFLSQSQSNEDRRQADRDACIRENVTRDRQRSVLLMLVEASEYLSRTAPAAADRQAMHALQHRALELATTTQHIDCNTID